MIQEYKQTPRPSGIYRIMNNANGKVFIGGSPNVPGKINSARFQLELGSHKCTGLQKEWNEYGGENFSFDTLELLEPSDDPAWKQADKLKALETEWLEKLQPYGEHGYNKRKA
ncbi:MAG: GIY-YIG nuclease family protein [Candidatus Aquicultorales bacterium]